MPIRISIRLLTPTGTLSLTEREDFLNEDGYKKYGWAEITGKKERACYVMLAPQIIGFLVFSIVPMLWAISLSCYNYNMIRMHFTGLENFKILLTDKAYWTALGNTFLYAIMKIPVELPLALILAVVLSKIKKGAGIYRAVYYLPHVVSIALLRWCFQTRSVCSALLTRRLLKQGFNMLGYNWFKTKLSSMSVVVIADIWMSFGVNVLYFIAALANIPEEVYESAELDGATAFQTFFQDNNPHDCADPSDYPYAVHNRNTGH